MRAVATAERSVTALPLPEVWDKTGALGLTGGEHLDRSAVEGLLRGGTVRMALAEVGKGMGNTVVVAVPNELFQAVGGSVKRGADGVT